MDAQIELGRRLVLGVIVAILSISVVVILSFVLALGTSRLLPQIIRLMITIVICMYLYKGAPWARWVLSALISVGGIMGILSGLGGLALAGANSAHFYMLLMGSTYIASVAVLWLAPPVRAYFRYWKEVAA